MTVNETGLPERRTPTSPKPQPETNGKGDFQIMTTQNSNTTQCWACRRMFLLEELRHDLRCPECDDADCDEQNCPHRSQEVTDAMRAELWERFAPPQFAIDPIIPNPVGPHVHNLSGCEVCREWIAERSVLAESHRRQFNGEDYQAVAQDLCDRMKNPRQEDYLELSSSPDPGCDCGFCRTAEWEV